MTSTLNSTTPEPRKRHTTPPSTSHSSSHTTNNPNVSSTSDSPLVLLFTATITVLVLLAYFHHLGMLGPGTWPSATNLHVVTPAQAHTFQPLIQQQHPFLLVFFSESCVACRRMKRPFVKACSKLEDYNIPCYAVNLSAKHDRQLVTEYIVKFVPSIFLVHGDERPPYDGKPSSASIARFALKHARDSSNQQKSSTS